MDFYTDGQLKIRLKSHWAFMIKMGCMKAIFNCVKSNHLTGISCKKAGSTINETVKSIDKHDRNNNKQTVNCPNDNENIRSTFYLTVGGLVATLPNGMQLHITRSTVAMENFLSLS